MSTRVKLVRWNLASEVSRLTSKLNTISRRKHGWNFTVCRMKIPSKLIQLRYRLVVWVQSEVVSVEPWFNEGPRDWQSMLAISGFFSIYFTIYGVKNIVRYTEDFFTERFIISRFLFSFFTLSQVSKSCAGNYWAISEFQKPSLSEWG